MAEEKTFDILRFAGLGAEKKVDPKKHFGSFNRRMMAATIDSLLMALLIAPLVDYAADHLFGHVAIDWVQLHEQAQAHLEQANAIIWQGIYGSGFLSRWLANCAIQTIALFLYSGLCWHYWSATPGKLAMRLKIVDAQTEGVISTEQILWRLGGYVVSTLGLLMGFFWISVDKRRQGWHDKIADTVVIVVPWRKAKSDPAIADQ